jgi:hypothetical protein
MSEPEEIRMPDDPARLVQHDFVEVWMSLLTSQGEQRSLLAGRCTTPHLRPNGAIVVVRPPFEAGRPPVRRGDGVTARFKRSLGELFDASGKVSWIRPKAFLPSGLAVSLVGITFDWEADDHGLELAAFLSRKSASPEEDD